VVFVIFIDMGNKYNKEILQEAVNNSKSYADVCRIFNIKDSTGAQTHLTKRIKEFGIDTAHFTGMGWRKGQTFKKEWVDINLYLVNGSKIGSHKLKQRLIREGLKEPKCECCGISEWLGEEVILELDHIDRNHHNNELSNLQILCPNCHALKTRKDKQNKVK